MSFKRLLISFVFLVVVSSILLFVSFRSVQLEHLVVGATNAKASKIPPAVFQFYLEHFSNTNQSTRIQNGMTPIQFLVVSYDLENFDHEKILSLMDHFIAQGVDINATMDNKDGLTAVHMSVLSHSPTLLGELLKRKADVNHPADGTAGFAGMTPLKFFHNIQTQQTPENMAAMESALRDAGAHE